MTIRQTFIITILLTVFSHCAQVKKEVEKDLPETEKLVSYVNPFIGTDGHGHTFPGATRPFGMVQLSPDTYNAEWDWCSGYHATDNSIMGFSHTHLSGTGRGDLLDILVMPTVGEVKTIPGSRDNPDEGYRSRFSHEKEEASPGYYAVQLEDYKIKAELTATARAGFHRYTFPKGEGGNVIIDPFHGREGDQVIRTKINIVNDTLITGIRESKGWGEGDEKYWCEQQVYFAAVFSKPFSQSGIVKDGELISASEEKGIDLKVFTQWENDFESPLLIKVGISAVDEKGALNNVLKEINHWDFERVKTEAEEEWEENLNILKVNPGADQADRETFYTALYHTMMAPTLYQDFDGRYLGFDQKIHRAEGFENYTTFSLWDTFRAANPLFTFTQPEKVNDFIKSMLAQYDQYGLLPVWSLYSSETNCMIGYHAVPVITEAYLKGIRDFDVEKAYEAMKTSAMQDDFGVKFLKEYNYIPTDLENKSVSKTLEYAYDDWCIAQMAEALGKEEDAAYFYNRAKAYANVYEPVKGFMRGKTADGKFLPQFDPTFASYGKSDFIEGNSWQYSWFVPHDVKGLIELMGGNEAFLTKMDSLFSIATSTEEKPLDVTGLIGEYAHGNEPSHHVAYLYNYAGQSWKAQEKVHEIMHFLYDNTRAGLCGNEDCGQMSAWYVFSALGFYPVNPAEGIYVIGTPLFEEVSMEVSGDKEFKVTASNFSEENKYIQSATLNGKPLERSYITYEEIIAGGELQFEMGDSPNKELWTKEKAFPPSM